MTRRETTLLKGVAILMMLFLHLFNTDFKIGLCQIGIDIAGIPLLSLLVRAANPVAFFVLLSGYGLYLSYCNGKQNQGKRIVKLYMHYWITLVIFVIIGYFVLGETYYPGTWQKVIENVSGWYTSYNAEIWFLFPYCLIALTSPFLFRWFDRINAWLLLGVIGVIYFITYLAIYLWGAVYLYSHQLVYMPVLYLNFLFPFVLGVLLAKYNIVNRCKMGGGYGVMPSFIACSCQSMYRYWDCPASLCNRFCGAFCPDKALALV